MAIGGLLMALGTGMNMYGNIKKSQAEAEAMEQTAFLKRLQASQMRDSAAREAHLALRRGERVRQAQLSSIGRSGMDVSSGSALALLAETIADARDEAGAIYSAGEYRAFTSNREAELAASRVSSIRNAGILNAFGGGLEGASRIPELTEQSYSPRGRTALTEG
jgi:hypothetical protein